jgi:hypothetical protein
VRRQSAVRGSVAVSTRSSIHPRKPLAAWLPLLFVRSGIFARGRLWRARKRWPRAPEDRRVVSMKIRARASLLKSAATAPTNAPTDIPVNWPLKIIGRRRPGCCCQLSNEQHPHLAMSGSWRPQVQTLTTTSQVHRRARIARRLADCASRQNSVFGGLGFVPPECAEACFRSPIQSVR